MADDLNALLEGARGDGSLPAPMVVNPLAAQNSAVTAATNMTNLQKLQAEKAAGEAYQGAISEDGEFDPNKFRKLLSASGPAAMAAGAALLNTQQISSDQLGQNLKKAGWVNSAAGAALQSGDFSDAGMLRIFQDGIAQGAITMPEATRQLALMPPDAEGRRRWLTEHQMRSGSLVEQLQQRQGTQQTISTPGASYVVNVPPIPAGQTVTVPHGPTPGSTTTVSVPYDDQGIIPRDANGVPTRPPKGWTSETKPVTAVPGVPTGGPPVLTPGLGGAPAPGTPAGVPPPGTIPVTPGQGVTPGRVVPTNPALRPPGSVSAPPAVATPAPTVQPPAITVPPQGQPQKVEADVKAYTEDQAARPAAMNSAQNLSHAYEALAMLKSNTGKGAQGINTLRSWAQTLGIAPAGAIEEQKLIELVTKYTEREMISAAGGSTTDMGRRMQEQANAGTLLSTPANFDIMRNDLGTKMQGIAANQAHASKDGVGYVEHRAKIASTTDPRGFVWNLYSPEEQARILKEVEKDPTAADHLHRAIGMVDKLQLRIPGSSPKPPPAALGKQSFLAPPAPMANPLLMPA